jgi:hypothetical protein
VSELVLGGGRSQSMGSECVSQSTPVREGVVVVSSSSASVSARSESSQRRQWSAVPPVGFKTPPVLSVHCNYNLCSYKSP